MQTNYYERRDISNSSLSLINPEQGGSPKLFLSYLEGTIQKTPPSPSLENGSLLHLYVENPNEFVVSEVVKPNESLCNVVAQYFAIKDSHLADGMDTILLKAARLASYYNNYKDDTLLNTLKKSSIYEYIAELELNEGKQFMTKEQKEVIEGCIEALNSHAACAKYLFQEWNGCEIFHEYEIYFDYLDVHCKARLDRLIVNHKDKQVILVDLKTTSKRAQFFPDSFEFWKYYRQMAFYKYALSKEFPRYSFSCYMPVVDTQYFTRHCYKISESQIDKGDIECLSLLNRVKWHMENNQWNYTLEEYNNNYLINI
ncbi:MAG: hypothetical protein EBU90_25580 [Proteobacteria bacterium]|jgi:hypothetical protein|nr:hypothetical protein [Pseudomonadota bacterium]